MQVPVAGQEQVEAHGNDEFAIPDLDGVSVRASVVTEDFDI